MWHVGIDLHRAAVVMAAVNDAGEAMRPSTIACEDTAAIVGGCEEAGTVQGTSGTYRWLYNLLRPYGTILLAHPLRLRAMIQRRSKTDKLDAQWLANLLRINQIPVAYIPPEPYQQLRDLTRCRARLAGDPGRVKIKLRGLLSRRNRQAPYRVPFGVRGIAWFRKEDFGPIENLVRDGLLTRLDHFGRQVAIFDEHIVKLHQAFPQAEALQSVEIVLNLYGAAGHHVAVA